MSGGTGEIIALIPAYNEVSYITDVVKGVLKYVPAVVVDDGSTDKTGAAAALAGAKVLVHPINQGKGKALNTGFDYAVQHDPDEIPLFIEAYRAGVGDLIIGQRDFSQMPSKNQFGNRTGTWLLGMAMGRPIPDNQSGYRLHSREVMRTVRPTTSRFEAEVEILLRAQMAGFHIAWVPIKTIYNDKVSHFRPIHDSALFLRMVWRIGRARRTGRFD
jgi:glycosyltransferase involved in cell wall biosynthesis